MKHSVTFSVETTPNVRVNKDKLSIEIAVSPVTVSIEVIVLGKDIVISSDSQFPQSDIDLITGLLSVHDGEPPKAFDHDLVDQREDVILRMNQMGQYHPLIDNDDLVRYLTKIDNALNGWRRSSNPVAVLEVVFADAGVSDIAGTVALQEDGVTPVDSSLLSFHSFLHTISNPVSGAKVFQFIAASIAEAS